MCLADAMWLLMSKYASTCPPEEVQVVLDGGAILHRIPWEKGLTYGAKPRMLNTNLEMKSFVLGLFCAHCLG